MTEEHIDYVLNLYNDRKTVEKQSYLASFEDIEDNDFNLNIPRYVDTFEKEEAVDINELLKEMKQTDIEIKEMQNEFLGLLHELDSTDKEIISSLNDCVKMFEEEI